VIKKLVPLLIFLMLYSFLSSAQKSVSIYDSVHQHIFTFQEIEYLEDPSGKLSITHVASSDYNSKFKPNALFNPSNPNRESAYWYRFKIKHSSQTKKNWVIEFFDQTIDHLEFYAPTDSIHYSRIVMGDESVFGTVRQSIKTLLLI
jgi:hypothetical protein